ncbi:MAG: hypothetical protein U0527_13850 [Candidatus Eisenbacteria bacterium]
MIEKKAHHGLDFVFATDPTFSCAIEVDWPWKGASFQASVEDGGPKARLTTPLANFVLEHVEHLTERRRSHA